MRAEYRLYPKGSRKGFLPDTYLVLRVEASDDAKSPPRGPYIYSELAANLGVSSSGQVPHTGGQAGSYTQSDRAMSTLGGQSIWEAFNPV